MKIAYLFNGHCRSWKDCHTSFFDNVYSVAPGDIYIHTWDRINSKYASNWNIGFGNLTEDLELKYSKPIELDLITEIYKPKDILVEEDPGYNIALEIYPDLKKIINLEIGGAHAAVLNAYLSQKKVFDLCQKHGEYDVYFYVRPDLKFINKFNIEELYHNEYMTVSGNWNPNIMIVDYFFFGSKKYIDSRSKFVYNMWDYWYSKNNWSNNDLVYLLEQGLTQYYKDEKIKVKPSSLFCEVSRIF